MLRKTARVSSIFPCADQCGHRLQSQNCLTFQYFHVLTTTRNNMGLSRNNGSIEEPFPLLIFVYPCHWRVQPQPAKPASSFVYPIVVSVYLLSDICFIPYIFIKFVQPKLDRILPGRLRGWWCGGVSKHRRT